MLEFPAKSTKSQQTKVSDICRDEIPLFTGEFSRASLGRFGNLSGDFRVHRDFKCCQLFPLLDHQQLARFRFFASPQIGASFWIIRKNLFADSEEVSAVITEFSRNTIPEESQINTVDISSNWNLLVGQQWLHLRTSIAGSEIEAEMYASRRRDRRNLLREPPEQIERKQGRVSDDLKTTWHHVRSECAVLGAD